MGRSWTRPLLALLLAIVGVAIGAGVVLLADRGPNVSPAVLGYEPDQLMDVPPVAPLIVTFNQPMDRLSVEENFSIQPKTAGKFDWKGASVTFVPDKPGLLRATKYAIEIGANAHSAGQKPLGEPFNVSFTTAGTLQPVAVQPSNGARDVATDNLITVAFNHPVVALESYGKAPDLDPIVISPSVQGKGKWLTTSVYRFEPVRGLGPATAYEVRIRRDLTDTTGGTLANDVSWGFTTVRPALSVMTPTVNSRYVPPTEKVTLEFNQAIDRASFNDRFRLTDPDGVVVGGTAVWESESRVVFVPTTALRPNATYRASVGADLKSGAGPLASLSDQSWTFQTVGPPRLVGSSPANGSIGQAQFGQVRLTFNQPMDRASFHNQIAVLPKPTQVYSFWTESDTQLNLSLTFLPSTGYQVEIGPTVRDRSGREIGAPSRIAFRTAATPARVAFRRVSTSMTMLAGRPVVVGVDSVNTPDATLRLLRVDRTEFMRIDNSPFPRPTAPATSTGEIVGEWRLATGGTLNEQHLVTQTVTFAGGPLPAGFYVLTLERTEVVDRMPIAVSRRALTLKSTSSEALIWAADPASGRPVPDARAVLVGATFSELGSGQTNADGVARIAIPALDPKQGQPRIWGFLDEPDGPSVVSSGWNNGIAPYDFELNQEYGRRDYLGEIYTDRPVYRPGQVVYIKGVVRKDDDGQLSLPTSLGRTSMTLRDPNGRVVLSKTLALDDYGVFHDALTIAQGSSTGYWSIQAQDQAAAGLFASQSFIVAEYRRPEYELAVSIGRPDYVQGDTIEGRIDARYYFGAPVSGAAGIWRVQSSPFTFRGPSGTEYAGFRYGVDDLRFRPFTQGPKPIASGTGKTDGQGRLAFRLPADISAESSSRSLTVEGTVTDSSNQEVSGRTEIVVHKSGVYVGLRSGTRVARAGDAVPFDVLTVDPRSAIRGGLDVGLDFAARRYYSVQEKTPEGDFVFTTKYEDTPIATATVKTATDGRARASFIPPKAGLYRLQATARDDQGNEARTVILIWASGGEYVNWGLENNDRIDVVLDKDEYRPGETARLLVASPYQTASALLTIERSGVRSVRVLTLSGSGQTIEIPVGADFIPNVFVSVVLFSGAGEAGPASYKLGYATLNVDIESKRLKVEVKSDKEKYRPGEKATYALKVTDAAGAPVQSQLSVAVVDLAVLSLGEIQSNDLLSTFFRRRGLGVQTAATLAASLARVDLASRAQGKGGGGEPNQTRARFADTVFWDATVTTDSRGEATLDVPLADNLTTWRLTAKAVTKDSRFGEATKDVVATKDLLVRPAAPRFLTSGDRTSVDGIVQNLTDRSVEVDAWLEARGVAAEGGHQKLSVPAGGSATASWPVRADAPGEARFVFHADTSGVPVGDAVEIAIPVHSLATAEVVATSGEVRLSTIEQLKIEGPVDRNQGELTVDLTPSLTAGFESGALYLRAYPWEPVELTISRLVANLVLARTLAATGSITPGFQSQLANDIPVAIQKIYRAQHQDGGWGWWTNDPSQPYLTAFAMFGLNEARRQGFATDPGVVTRATGYLNNWLRRPVDYGRTEDVNTRAYLLWVLSDAGQPNVGQSSALYERRDALGQYGRGFLVLAMAQGGRLDQRGQGLLSELSSSAIWSATGAHWEEAAPGRQTFGSTGRSTAVVLDALVRLDPANPIIESAVRWLMANRREGAWLSPHETAWVLVALTDYLKSADDRSAEYRYRVALNGRDLANGAVDPTHLDGLKLRVDVAKLLVDSPNRLDLIREASAGAPAPRGRLYYTAALRTFRPGDRIDAKSEGLTISREYLPADEKATTPISSARAGEMVRVKLTIVAPADLSYLLVEDPLPAGAEAIDPRLRTTSIFERATNRQSWRWSHVDVRDDRVGLFASYLPKGTYEYSYLVRLTRPGRYLAQPARASELYFPEVWGRSVGGVLEVLP